MKDREYIVQPKELTHVRFYFKQIDMLKEALNNEQMGRLFFALAEYAQTGVEKDVGGGHTVSLSHDV